MPQKTEAIIEMANELKEKGLIDGIGMQSHLDARSGSDAFPSVSAYEKALKAFTETGLDVQITELDVTVNDNTLFDEQDMVSTDAYLKSSDSAYTANVDISQTTGQVNIGDALVKGQQNYMAVGSKAKFTDDNKTLYSNVIAVGSEGMLSDTYLQYSQYQNSEYFISVINGLTGKTAGITITPKTITGNVFDITQQQKTVLKWTFCLGVPVVVLIVGIVIWARRKNK